MNNSGNNYGNNDQNHDKGGNQNYGNNQGSANNRGVDDVRINTGYDWDGPVLLPLKWHKFLAYFGLWLGAVVNLSNAVRYLNGMVYEQEGVPSADVYRFYGDGLKNLDMMFGFVILIIAGYLAITALGLIKYKAYAPKMLISSYIINAVANTVYILMTDNIIKAAGITEGADMTNVVVIIFSAILWASLNHSYYKKREALFVY